MQRKDINRHWERVINTMNEALLIISKEGRILSVNRSFEEMTGYAANEVTGQPCTVLACRPVKWPSTIREMDGASCSNPTSRKCAAAAAPSKKRTGPFCRR
jgi:transcriptional regulator with PAS, ATPase and Fis domain